MTKSELIKEILAGRRPPYVPWDFSFTFEAAEKLKKYYGTDSLDHINGNHLAWIGGTCRFEDIGNDCFRDAFGVIWDRSEDKDIGIVKGTVLPEPDISLLKLPDIESPIFFEGAAENAVKYADRFKVFSVSFSLFERAWTMRGMENLLMDFYENPEFARNLLRSIADFNIELIRKSLAYGIDGVYFGDDWGQQKGLIMGPDLWREFILPELKRMYSFVKQSGKYVFIHSCGDVDELFDDLIAAGLDCFNPFQPEVMDVPDLMTKYKGRLSFHGGLSTQRTLPYGSVEDVRNETLKLLKFGCDGNYIFAPAHAVEGDVPLENILAFIEIVKNQKGL